MEENNAVKEPGQAGSRGPDGIATDVADDMGRDFTGMTAEEIAGEIARNGLKVSEMASINAALDAEMERREEEYRQESGKDWTKFSCHPADVEFSIPFSEADNYTGEFYSHARCEVEAHRMLRGIYKEAEEIVSRDHLYTEALNEIIYFAEGCFEEEQLRLSRCNPDIDADSIKKCLDLDRFRKEVEEKLQNIRIRKLKSYDTYFKMIEFDDSYGGEEGIAGVIARFRITWNYCGTAAYWNLKADAEAACRKYVDEATKAARSALRKRTGWLEELKAEQVTISKESTGSVTGVSVKETDSSGKRILKDLRIML